jgi:glutamine synthetase
MEFFYFKSPRTPEPLDDASYFDLTQMDMVSELRKQTILTLEAMGIPVEYSFHELGPSQHEIDLRYTDALTMADNVMTFRLVVKEVAQDLGVYATFMPKPLAHAFGSGMHTHLSLFEGDVNAFHDPGDSAGLSKVGKNFIAGLLRHAPEITAVTNQWVNSYKRLSINSEAPIVGYEAPTYVCWARNNRSALVRVPLAKKGKEDSTRIEFRSPDPACNPYLAFSLMLAAGLKGVDEGYELAPEATNNIFEMTPEERAAEGIDSLPRSLAEAVDVMEDSELVAEALGEHVFEHFIRNKRSEWADYRGQVTPWELDRYLGAL